MLCFCDPDTRLPRNGLSECLRFPTRKYFCKWELARNSHYISSAIAGLSSLTCSRTVFNISVINIFRGSRLCRTRRDDAILPPDMDSLSKCHQLKQHSSGEPISRHMCEIDLGKTLNITPDKWNTVGTKSEIRSRLVGSWCAGILRKPWV